MRCMPNMVFTQEYSTYGQYRPTFKRIEFDLETATHFGGRKKRVGFSVVGVKPRSHRPVRRHTTIYDG